jgi:lipopolysaccharide/colanic/teichoic acid biosynthesis glycosyltransferase
VTGRTQIWLRHEETLLAAQPNPMEFYEHTLLPQKVISDVTYVNEMSLKNDLGILFSTALCLLSSKPKVVEVPTVATVSIEEQEELKAA